MIRGLRMGELEDLRAEIEKLNTEGKEMRRTMQAEIDSLREDMARERALDRQRLSRLESRPPKPKPATEDRIAKLDRVLLNCYPAARTFDEVGKLLQFGENHAQIMTSFSKHLLPFEGDRYIFGDSNGRGTGKTIRLSSSWKAELDAKHFEKNAVQWDD